VVYRRGRLEQVSHFTASSGECMRADVEQQRCPEKKSRRAHVAQQEQPSAEAYEVTRMPHVDGGSRAGGTPAEDSVHASVLIAGIFLFSPSNMPATPSAPRCL